MTMEINTKTVFTLLLASLLSGCYVILDDSGYDSYDSYDIHYGSTPWIDADSTYWYCEDYYEHGEWHNYWEFYTVAIDEDGYSDIWSVEYRAYYYDGYLAFEGDLYSEHILDSQAEEYFTTHTSSLSSLSCSNIYEVEFYVEDWDGNYDSLWVY